MATAEQIVSLNLQHPNMTSKEIAVMLGCNWGYVRATGQRKGLTFASGRGARSSPRRASKRTSALLRRNASFEVRFTEAEQLAEIFFEVFDALFPQRTAFERRTSLAEEYRAAMCAGQTLTGFLMGDPLPCRSANNNQKRGIHVGS